MKTYQLTNPVPVSAEGDIPLQFKADSRLKAAQKAFRVLSKRIKNNTDGKKTTTFLFSLVKVDGDAEPHAKDSVHFEGTKSHTSKGTAKLTVKCFTPSNKKMNTSQKLTVGPGKYTGQKTSQKGGTDEKKTNPLFPWLCGGPYDPWAPYALSANNYLFYNPLWYGDLYYSNAFFNGYPFLGLMYPFDAYLHAPWGLV